MTETPEEMYKLVTKFWEVYQQHEEASEYYGYHAVEQELKQAMKLLNHYRSQAAVLREALEIATQTIDIALDWHAPEAYDIKVPASWDEAKDPESEEPDWPTGHGIVDKCRKALAATEDQRGE